MNTEELSKLLGDEFAFIFNEINPVIQSLELDKIAKILDIGTGMGRMAITLALNNYKVVTGEPEDDESEYGKQDWLESAKKVEIEHMINFLPFNAENMNFQDDTFDAIFILGALHHINDIKTALKECVRVLRSDGVIVIFEPNSKLMKIIRENRFPSHPDAIDPTEFTQDLNLVLKRVKRPFYDTYIFRKL